MALITSLHVVNNLKVSLSFEILDKLSAYRLKGREPIYGVFSLAQTVLLLETGVSKNSSS